GGELELLVPAELGHQVVVVGVEPLGQLQGGHAPARPLPRAAPGHGKVGLQAHRAPGPAEALRDGAHHTGHVQHVVIEGEVVGGDDVDPHLLLQLPVAQPQFLAGLEEVRLGELPFPVPLRLPLQLPMGADPGKAQVGRNRHPSAPFPRAIQPGTWSKGRPKAGPGGSLWIRWIRWIRMVRRGRGHSSIPEGLPFGRPAPTPDEICALLPYWGTFSQSFRKRSSPTSVMGWWKICCRVSNRKVMTSAPTNAAWSTCWGWRTG